MIDLSNQSWPTKLQLLQLQRIVSQENCDVYSSWVLSFKDLLENEEYDGNTGCGFQTGGGYKNLQATYVGPILKIQKFSLGRYVDS